MVPDRLLLAASGVDLRKPPEPVTLLLEPGWAGRDVDIYARFAWASGLFADAGLAVRLGLGTPSSPAAGPQLAVVDAAAAAGDEPGRWQVVATIHQRTSTGLIGFADTDLAGPADLPGRRVGLPPGSVARALWPAYAARTAGLDPTAVTTVDTDDPVAELAAGRLDAVGLPLIAAPGLAAATGRSVTVLPYAQALPERYGSVLMAPRSLLRDRAGLVHAFTTALLTAARFAMDDPADVARVLHRAYLVDDPELVAAELLTMSPFVGCS